MPLEMGSLYMGSGNASIFQHLVVPELAIDPWAGLRPPWIFG